MSRRQLIVLGGGPGGYAAAFHAADLGVDVTLVEKRENPGGVCLYEGCIPSKALLHAARVLREAEEAAAMGIDFPKPTIDLDKLRGWKDGVVSKLTLGLGHLAGKRAVEHVVGEGRLLDAHRLEVQAADGQTQVLEFESLILATGSHPTRIPFFPEDPRIVDSTGALLLEDVPGKLLVVGGGYIGLELGTVYAALGSAVTVVEMVDRILPGADEDLVQPLERRLRKQFDSILTATKVAALEPTGAGVLARLQGPDGDLEETFDRVLVAVGRRPNSAGLGLESTRVVVDSAGFVTVDEQRRTAEPSVFAIGDVAGEPMLAHKATHEGRVAAEVVAGKKSAYDPRAIPAVVFTDPEIAWVGVTEEETRKRDLNVKITRFPWSASGRALTLGRTDGLTKMIVDAATGRLLGVGMTGPGAGDMIAEAVVAIEMGATAEDLALSIHPHPTLSETIMEAGELVEGAATHLSPPR